MTSDFAGALQTLPIRKPLPDDLREALAKIDHAAR